MQKFIFAALVGITVLSPGCGDESTSPTVTSPAPTPAEDSHAHADGSTHAPHADAPTTTPAEHGRIPIGETSQAGLKLVATQDAPVTPGGEGAFDVVITGGKPKAVRFWVGTEDAKRSVKAKAEEETPDHWHAHAEVPGPLPAGSKFWVEVELPTGQSFKTSFDVKQQ
ncbi:MAG: hypothetical protein M3478_02945 [Planctomycetota bacterium]|nr:hypothetical protein [Planctomycetota bacterium]